MKTRSILPKSENNTVKASDEFRAKLARKCRETRFFLPKSEITTGKASDRVKISREKVKRKIT